MAEFQANFNIEPRETITTDFEISKKETIDADFVIYAQTATVAWGGITGTLSNQADLQSALDNKYDASNPNKYIPLTALSSRATGLTYSNTTGVFSLASGYEIPLSSTLATFITKDVNNLTNYMLTSDINTALSGKQDTISNLSTIESNASNGQTAYTTIQGYGDIVSHNVSEFATSAQGTKADSALQSIDVINNVTSATTDKPLSANMGKELQDEIDNLKARGRFLALWNCTTGLAETQPTTLPYDYKTGDYFIIGTVGETNYKPSGSQYTGTASTVVETSTVSSDDVYYYDGNVWHLQINTQKTVSFANIAGQPTDNSNLASALNSKQPTIDSSNKLSSDLVDDTNHTNKFVTADDITRLDDLNVQYKETTVPEETLDLSTITVSSEGATYGYSYNSNTDRLEPANVGIDSSFAYGKISFTVTADRTLSVSIMQGSESGYDYGVVSNLDQTLEQSIELDSEYKWAGNTTSSATETLEYDLTAGTHFITFKYIKDGSSATSPDMMAITEIKLGESTTKGLFDYDTGEEIDVTPDLSDYAKKSDLTDYMTLDTEQTATAKKIFSFTEPIAYGGQESIVKVLSTHTNSEISSQPMWAGRMMIGAKDRTFLMGVYHQTGKSKSLCGLGAHTWSDAFTQSGAAWEDVYIQPDGSTATYIGGNEWTPDSGWLKVQNNGASSASYRTYINTGTATSPSWKTVLPNMNTGTNSVFITPYISNTSSYSYSVSMGYGATPTNTYATNIGYSAHAGSYGASFGSSATASGSHSVALGASSTASGSYSIQLGQGTNSTANTMYVGLSSSLNVQLLDSAGVIPIARIPDLTLSKVTDVTATATELNYCSGVTSSIQTQLNGKQAQAIYDATNERLVL